MYLTEVLNLCKTLQDVFQPEQFHRHSIEILTTATAGATNFISDSDSRLCAFPHTTA